MTGNVTLYRSHPILVLSFALEKRKKYPTPEKFWILQPRK
jgi:hypothetical protein